MRWGRGRRLIVPVLALVFAGAVAAALVVERGDGDDTFTLADARAFDEFALFYAGESVAGIPLVTVDRHIYDPKHLPDSMNHGPAVVVTFIYGTCHRSGDEGGCAPPAQVQVWPACVRNLSLYGGPLNPAPPRTTVRGVPAGDRGAGFEIQTGDVTIVIFAGTRELALAVAAALEGVNVSVEPGAPLPDPVPGALGGTLACGS